MSRYFRITVLRGHNHHRDRAAKRTSSETITFYFMADSLLEACDMARSQPGVKHNDPCAVQKAVEISQQEYKSHLGSNAYKTALGAEYRKKKGE